LTTSVELAGIVPIPEGDSRLEHEKTFKPFADDRNVRAQHLERLLQVRDSAKHEAPPFQAANKSPEIDTVSQAYTRPLICANPGGRENIDSERDESSSSSTSSSDWEEVESLSSHRFAPATWI